MIRLQPYKAISIHALREEGDQAVDTITKAIE